MTLPVRKDDRPYTYADILSWSDGQRWELIEGVAYAMTPSPSMSHQTVLLALASLLHMNLGQSTCRVFVAPYDLRLPEHRQDTDGSASAVQPDIMIVCDAGKLSESGCTGAPDFVAEIVSPSSASIDYIQKLRLYEKHGVKEYWIVHPIDRMVTVYSLESGVKYGRPVIYSDKDTISLQLGIMPVNVPLPNIFV